jgi:hypothetical protein
MMHLIQILLPIRDNEGVAFEKSQFDEVRSHLADRFGGVTIYMRAPASGIWKEDGEEVRDEIIIFEVMAEDLEREFWRLYRLQLQDAFRQEIIVVRAQLIDLL